MITLQTEHQNDFWGGKSLVEQEPHPIQPILAACIEKFLAKFDFYDEKQVHKWSDEICEECIKILSELSNPFKFAVTCTIMQTTAGAGICMANSACVDTNRGDCIWFVKWPVMGNSGKTSQVTDGSIPETECQGKGAEMICIVAVATVSV